ncbi:conserved hypothetical protein [Vibrio chagasii]|nr:conserved hypothetical protein [Vibrio chagasii]
MAKATFFMGIPCTGKTTHRNKHHKGDFVLSRDDLREKIIAEHELEYHQLFISPDRGERKPHPVLGAVTRSGKYERVEKANKDLDELFQLYMKGAINELFSGRDVVIDLLNVTVAERKEYIEAFGSIDGVELHAKTFEFKSQMELIHKLNAARCEQGKMIPKGIIEHFAKVFEKPIANEGFVSVEHINGLDKE